MEKEYSAGAVIFRYAPRTQYLLVYSERNKAWGFPKGHIDAGEAEKDAALREIAEETGITDLRFVPGFREELEYKTISNRGQSKGKEIEKHTTYFLCQTGTGDVVIDGEEITYYEWLNMYDAKEYLTIDSLKELLRKTEVFIDISIPKDAKWKKIAVSQQIDRYVLDITKYGLPYYEVESIGMEDHKVSFVVPMGTWVSYPDARTVVSLSYPPGPYFDFDCFKAIREDSKKRGLPSEIEGVKNE